MKKSLKNVKSGAISRGASLARATLSIGATTASHAIGGLFSSADQKEARGRSLLLTQVTRLARELGELKGAAMKGGQMLSVLGEHFLPEEVNAVLRELRDQSPPLTWKEMEKTLKRSAPSAVFQDLEIETEALASASIGQVHLARRKSDGEWICLKIQYPGVEESIEGDLKNLRRILSVARFLPAQSQNDTLFQEVSRMLHQEVDYTRELKLTEEYRALVATEPRVMIPKLYPEYSSKKVLASQFIDGFTLDGAEVATLSQERRNRLASLAQDLVFREVFHWGIVQTDPHAGNYRVRTEGDQDRLVLFDFGAVRKYPVSFLVPYRNMIQSTIAGDRERAVRSAMEFGLLREGDKKEDIDFFYETCILFIEPFLKDEVFSWRGSNLPKRIAKKGTELALRFKFRPPPEELIFLDRKLIGTFTLLSLLGAKLKPKDLLLPYLEKT